MGALRAPSHHQGPDSPLHTDPLLRSCVSSGCSGLCSHLSQSPSCGGKLAWGPVGMQCLSLGLSRRAARCRVHRSSVRIRRRGHADSCWCRSKLITARCPPPGKSTAVGEDLRPIGSEGAALPDGRGLCVREGLSLKIGCPPLHPRLRCRLGIWFYSALIKNQHPGPQTGSFSTRVCARV